jgi:hypothetical protein
MSWLQVVRPKVNMTITCSLCPAVFHFQKPRQSKRARNCQKIAARGNSPSRDQ